MIKKLIFIFFIVSALTACFEDRYRYICQNPDKFDLPECQKPKCLFTQTCPEYLVAPILVNKPEEKKVEDVKK